MKRTNRFLLIMALMMMPGFLMSTFAQKSIFLKYNLKKGDNFQSTMHMSQDVDMEVKGQSMTITQEMDFEFDYQVLDATADSFDLQTIIRRVKMNQSVMGMEIVYDSKDSTTFKNAMVGTQISDEMNKLIDAAIVTTVSNDGNVGSIDLGTVDPKNDIAKNMKSSFSQAVYPDHKVKVGDTWTNDIATEGMAKMNMHMTYTLKKFTKKQAFIGVVGTIDSPDTEAKLKGTLTGDMTVDRKTGWVTKSTFDQDFEMQMEQQGMSFPATISGSYEINSKKVK